VQPGRTYLARSIHQPAIRGPQLDLRLLGYGPAPGDVMPVDKSTDLEYNPID
jgi:hypothetical protein